MLSGYRWPWLGLVPTVLLAAACGPQSGPISAGTSSPSPAKVATPVSAMDETVFYYEEAGDKDHMIPVRWSDLARQGALPFPTVAGQQLAHLTPSPDGHFFLGSLPSTQGAASLSYVLDAAGHVLAQLPKDNAVYVWSVDSSALCALHDQGGTRRQLGLWSLSGRQERTLATFDAAEPGEFDGPIACAPGADRILVAAFSASGPGTADKLTVYDHTGRILAQRREGATGHDVRVLAADDGVLYAENPAHQAEPAVVRNSLTGQVVATLPGRHVRFFDGRDDAVVTTDAPPDQPTGPVLQRIQLQRVASTNTVLWEATGILQGATIRPTHQAMVLALADSVTTARDGFRMLVIDDAAHPHLLTSKGFFVT